MTPIDRITLLKKSPLKLDPNQLQSLVRTEADSVLKEPFME